jgi:hypothetical protein
MSKGGKRLLTRLRYRPLLSLVRMGLSLLRVTWPAN